MTYSQDKLLKILIGRKEDLAKTTTSPPLPVNIPDLNTSESMIASKLGILFLRLRAFIKKHFIEELLT